MSKKSREPKDELEEEFEVEKQLALDELRPWIEALSEEELNEPQMSVGPKTFTPLQIVREIEGSTEYGRLFVRRLSLQRIELASRKEKTDEC